MNEVKDFSHLIGTPGFSDALLSDHFGLYEGYVTNVNKFAKLSQEIETGTPQYSELKRRFGWEWNGMKLHELYFENITKQAIPIDKSGRLSMKIEEKFQSFDAWEKDFRATGAIRGVGWAVLAYDPNGDGLFNVWVNEHDAGHLAGCTPLLVMDVFEHAYIRDYGIKRASYIEAFMKAIDWDTVQRRYE